MNGIKLKSRPVKKGNQSNFRLLACVVLSNLFLLLLLYPGKAKKKELHSHKNMEKLLLPMRIFVPLLPGRTEYPAELYDEKHRLLTRPVFLHPDFSNMPSLLPDAIHHMPVEVPKKAVKRLIGKSFFLVFPYQKEILIEKKRRINYEIVF